MKFAIEPDPQSGSNEVDIRIDAENMAEQAFLRLLRGSKFKGFNLSLDKKTLFIEFVARTCV